MGFRRIRLPFIASALIPSSRNPARIISLIPAPYPETDAIKALVFSSRLDAIFPMVSPPAVAMPAAAAILRKFRRVHNAVFLSGCSSGYSPIHLS